MKSRLFRLCERRFARSTADLTATGFQSCLFGFVIQRQREENRVHPLTSRIIADMTWL